MGKARPKGGKTRPALAFIGILLFALGLFIFYAAGSDTFSILPPDQVRMGLLAGMASYLLVHRFFGVGDFFATFTHELCHTALSLLSGGKPLKFYASQNQGGYAHLTRTNFLVALAPYFLPIWAVLGVLAFRLFIWVRALPFILPFAAFFTGAALMHHVLCLLHSCRPHQPDLKRYGLVFSYGFIVFANSLILPHLFMFTASPEAPWHHFLGRLAMLAAFHARPLWESIVTSLL